MIEIWNRLEESIKNYPEGFTFNPRTMRVVNPTKGYAVGTTPFDVKRFIDFDSNEHLYIGYWENELDVVVIADYLDEAMSIARYYHQKYIYDFRNKQDIKVVYESDN